MAKPDCGYEIGLLRHFKDEEYSDADGKRDTGVKLNQLEVEQTASQVLKAAKERGCNRVVFQTSELTRALHTSQAMAQELQRQDPKLAVFEYRNKGLSPLEHGRYANGSNGRAEKLAWEAFVKETFDKGQIFYRHGDPIISRNGEALYPELEGKFIQYGENQVEFTRRVYTFFLSLADAFTMQYGDPQDKCNSLHVISAHTAILMRLLEMNSVAAKKIECEPGKMYQHEWAQSFEVDKGQYKKTALQHGGFDILDIQPLVDYREPIANEVRHLMGMVLWGQLRRFDGSTIEE
jgi:broad specificity phosphatase PhoE